MRPTFAPTNSRKATNANTPKNARQRGVRRTVIAAAIAIAVLSIAVVGSNAARGSFVESVKEFLGVQPTHTSFLKAQPEALTTVQSQQPLAPTAVMLSWNTFGNLGTETTEPSTANDPNLSAANLTFGAGVTPAANTNRFGGDNWFDTGNTAGGNTLAQAIAGNNYIQFVVTPNAGFSFTPTSLVFNWDHSGTGPLNVTLRSSADSFSTDLGTVTGTAAIGTSNTITISSLTNLTAATTFRLYGYGATGTAGTGGFDTTTNANNVILNGTAAALPTLGTYANTSLQLSANTTVTPSAAPTNTTRLTVATSTNFKGRLEGSPTTGIVRVTDAHPAGAYSVTIKAFNSVGATASQTFTLTVTTPTACGSPTFGTKIDSTTGNDPHSIAVGDFNNDGKQDIATANSSAGTVSDLLGDGAGNFGVAINSGVNSGAASVAVGDFNGDGNQDLATANSGSANVSVVFGNGTGNFSANVNFPVNTIPKSVAVGDFNADGKQDIVTANSGSNNVSVLIGDGAGGFAANVNFSVGTDPRSVVVGDFNGDAKQDLAAANVGTNNVSILLGNGAGSFGAATNFGVGTSPVGLALGEFNGDGFQDLVTANSGGNNVTVLFGNGVGNFPTSSSTSMGVNVEAVAVGDFNSDGKQDLAVANTTNNSVTIMLGSGTGSFSTSGTFAANSAPRSIAVGDFNADGRQDFITANDASNNASRFLGQCSPSISVSGGPLNFSNTSVGSSSGIQNYLVSGSNLTANLVVTAPSTDFEVSTSSIGPFGPSVSLTPSSGTVNNTSIFVRFTPQSTGLKSGNVTNASTGATTQNVAVSGTGVPVLNVTNDPSVAEGDAGTQLVTFTVTLTPASSQTVTVHYSTQDNSATAADNDYVALTDTLLTFNPTETTKNITVTINGDTKFETNEQFFFNINTPSNANISDNQGIGTITNDDPTPTLNVTNNPTVTEGNAGTTLATFNVTLSNPSYQNVTVHYSTQDNSATTANNDYVAIADTLLTFLPGETSKNIDVTVNGDTNLEPTEQFFFNINTPLGANISDNQGIGTITADDFELNVTNNPTVTEGNAGTTLATFNVTLNPASANTVTVHYATQDNSATTADNDYVAIPDTLLTFTPGQTSKNINVTVNGDTTFETNEQFFFNISFPLGANISDNQGIGTITNDDTAASDHFRSTVFNGDWAIAATWESSPTGSDPWIPATLAPTTAANTITIITSSGVTVSTNVSADQVVIQNGGGLTVINGGTLTIADGAGTDLAQTAGGFFAAEGTGQLVNNGQTNMAGLVSRSNGGSITGTNSLSYSGALSKLYYNFTLGAGGTTTNDTEFPAVNGPANLQVFVVDAPVTLHANRTITGTLTPETGVISTGSNTLTVAAGGTVQRDGVNQDGYVNGNLQRTFGAAGSLTFDVGTANGYSPVAVNATAGTFPANFTVKATEGAMPGISGANKLARYWTLTNSTVTNANLTFNYLAGDVTGTVASYQFIKKTGGALSILAPTGTPTSTTATINGVTSFSDWTLAETNAVQFGTIQFSSASYNVGEGDGNASIIVTRAGGTDGNVSVHYSTSDVAADNSDYTSQSGTFNWAAGDSTTRTITVPITNDTTYEGNEDFNVDLDAPGGGATLGAFSGAVVNIIENDALPSFSIDDVSHNEGDAGTTSYVFTVTKTGATALNSEVNFTTVNGSATVADNDYQANANTLLFLPGDTTKPITVLVNGDTTFEPNEAFTVNLNTPVDATISDANGTGTITNDDVAGETDVVVSGGNLVISDANGGTTNDTLTISLVGVNIRINDPNNTLTAGVGATQIDANTVEVPLASISGTIQVNTLGGDDVLTLAFAGGDFIPAGGVSYAGGAQTSIPGDKLLITGGAQGTVTYNYTSPNDGSIVMSAFGTVSYTGLEPIANSGSASDVIFNLPAGPSAATLADDGTGGNTLSTLSGATFEATTFANPTGSVTINRGNAADTLAVNALPDLNSSLTLGTTANPFSTITFNGAITLAANKNLFGDASSTISLPNATSDLATSGTGTIALTTARDISLASGSSITTVNGALTLNANPAGTTAGTFAGISFNDGTVQATGTGLVTLTGHGGAGGGIGIYMTAGQVGGGTSGTANLSGTGGLTNGIGIWLDSANSLVTSAGANVQVTGTGGGTGAAANNAGMLQTEGAVVTAGGSGSVTLLGTGGSGSGGNNIGFQIAQTSQVTSGGGNIQITGVEGEASTAIDFNAGSITTVTNGGNITVIGNSISVNAAITANAASSVTFRPFTNGAAINLGGADSIGGPLGLTDFELDNVNAGTLNIGNANSGAITVTSAITRAAATSLNLTSGANIDFSTGSLHSNGGNVSLIPGTNVFPATTGTDVTTSAATTLALTSGKDLKIDIDGTTVDTGYTQLNVAGLVNLNGANLSFAGSSYTPVGSESFTIVNNDGADAITGTFNGLAEGATITNFLGSGLNATLTYTGGDGNDAVLTVAAACGPQSTVYVDDSWVGTTIGTDPDAGGPATNFGCDSFATIQGGINGVTAGGTVNVAAGNYVENVILPKALTLTGAGAASVFVYPSISDPNCGGAGGGSLCAGSSNLMLVQANNVTISGMTLDGDNTSLPGGITVGGANIDARNGVITNHVAGVFNNLEVHHVTVKNIYLRGVYASSGGSFNFHDNTVQNVQASAASIGMFNFGGAGAFINNNVSLCNDAISSNHSRGTTYTGNTVTTSASGIHTDNAGDGGGTPDTMSGNTVTNSQINGYGIWVYVPYKTVTVQNNTVTNVDVGLAVFGDSGVTTTTKPQADEKQPRTAIGRTAPTSANINEPGVVLAPRAFNDGSPAPNAPPVAPFSASFTGNTVDGQNKVNSTGVYFTTSQIALGSGNPKVKFTTNTVLNNADGFFLEAETGFTLETAASFNRIVNNTGSQATQNTGVGFAGTVNGSMENNWWGCNAGPGNAGCGVVIGAGIDFNPWIVLGISASPGTISPGGISTITADMTHNSVNAVPSVTDFVPQVAVTFGATNGTVFPTSGTIVNGQATTTFTSNSTNSGTAAATVDNQTVQTPVNVSAANTYTWTGTLSSDWQIPLNWTPTRVLSQATDILLVDGTSTPGPTITNIPTQTISALRLLNGAFVTLNGAALGQPHTLTVNGAAGSDLSVPASCLLALDGSNGLSIKLSGVGTTGTIGGTASAGNGFHRFFGDANATITFQNGALGTAGPGLTTNMFGTGGAGDGQTGSVIFASGSIYSHNAGDSPFGTVGNGPVVTFQTGSLARWFSNSGFQASGRTYANLQIGAGLLNAFNLSDSGTGNFQFDNLDIKSTSSATSSLTYTGSGGATITIRGDITSTGAGNTGSLPDLTLTPGSGGTHVNKIGGGTLILNATGNSRAIDLEGGATVENGTTLSLSRVVLLGIANPHLNTLRVNSTAGLTGGSSSSYVVGGVEKISMPTNFIFPVGTAGAYSPVDLANATTGDLRVAARTPQQPVLAPATSLQRYWTLTEGDALTADLTFHYLDPTDVAGNEANYQVVVVESGNATSFPADTNHSVDALNNRFTVLGVQNFSDWTAAEPAAPTAVKLSSFNATRFANGAVELNWQSGYEVRNLGYNVYREQNGQRVALTPSLVAGSALMAGRQTQLTAGLSYSWADELGVRGKGAGGSNPTSAISNPKSPVTYWLEDVDVDGTRTLHGPIAVSDCSGADCKKLSERSRLLSEVANPQSAISNQQSGVALNGYPAATAIPDPSDPEPDPTEMQRTIAGMPALKLSVSRPGWYRLTQPEVLAAGLNIADANGLQLYRDGRQVAFRLSNNTEQFGPTDYLEFYGDGLSSTTASAQTYYLVKLAAAGKRIELKPQQVSPGDRVSPQGFAYTVERKERMIYFSGLLNGDAENFFGQVVSTSAVNATIPITHLDPTAQSAGTPAQVEVVLQGVTAENHAVQVRINGTDLGTINFANTEHPSQTLSVPATAIHDGNNTIELTALGGATDVSLVDVLRLTYRRSYAADNNALTFNLNSRQTKKITGFTSDQIRVVDVSDPYNVLELTPHIAPDGSGFAAMIGVDVEVRAPFSRPHELLAFAIGDAASVDAIRLNSASNWSSETAGADYLVLTTSGLAASVQPLAQLRQAQGLVVKVIDVEDLYDEFSFGAHSPKAIRDLLAKATADWTRKPHYVVFAGDASYDPKNYLGQGLNDLVPTKLIDTTLAETASDDWLADFNNDGIADVALGRLPVRTSGELNTLVNKIVNYENAVPDPSRGALLVSDTGFEASNGVVQGLLPSGMTVSTINRSAANDTTVHNQIIAGLNQGPLVANYIGHGSNGVWTGAALLSNDDAPLLTNTNRLSVFTMMTCYNGFFQNAFNDSLSETLLKAPGGAVAVWASTTLTDPAGQNAIDQEFYRLLFGAQPATIGDAARAAKFVTGDPNVRRTWTLFGDPALRLR